MSSFQAVQESIEQDIKKIAKNVTSILSGLCSKQNAACQSKSFYQCQGTSEKYCVGNYPRLDQCAFDGAMMSYHSSVRFPGKGSTTKNPNSGTDYQRLLVCGTTGLDPIFRQIKEKYTNQIQRVYVGFSPGLFRVFPGVQQNNTSGNCEQDYDCRTRPWYTGATTGSKKVVIAIDTSINMKNYFGDVKNSVQKLIRTLGLNDFLGMIYFSQTAKIKTYQSLNRATVEIKDSLINTLKNSETTNLTSSNYDDAFQAVKTVIMNTGGDKYGEPCKNSTNIILFITSSSPTIGSNTSSQIIQKISKWNPQLKTKLFTFALGNKVQYNLLKQLSCNLEGTAFQIGGSQVLVDRLKFFQTVLTSKINIDTPIWSEPYNDAFTKERMITISIPVYRFYNGSRNITAAIGIDFLMKQMQKYQIYQTKVVTQLMKCSPTQPILLDPCLLQYQRPQYAKCNLNINNCQTFSNLANQCIYKPQQNILSKQYVTGYKQKYYTCCGISKGAFIGVIVGVSFLVLIGLAVLIGCLCYRAWRARNSLLRNIHNQPSEALGSRSSSSVSGPNDSIPSLNRKRLKVASADAKLTRRRAWKSKKAIKSSPIINIFHQKKSKNSEKQGSDPQIAEQDQDDVVIQTEQSEPKQKRRMQRQGQEQQYGQIQRKRELERQAQEQIQIQTQTQVKGQRQGEGQRQRQRQRQMQSQVQLQQIQSCSNLKKEGDII